MTKVEQLINDTKVNKAFEGTKFENVDHRAIIKEALLKVACGFSIGDTTKHVLDRLELITTAGSISKKGRKYLFYSYYKN